MSEKSKNILLGVLIVGLVSMTVAYAALTTNLRIVGTANVAETKWDIHFASVTDATSGPNTLGGTNEGTVVALGTLDNSQTATTGTLLDGLRVSLKKPGDFAKVTFNIENAGTIDAKLGSFSKHMKLSTASGDGATTDTNEGITYTISCSNDSTKVTPVANASVQEIAKKTSGTNGVVACELYVHYNELGNDGGSTGQASQTPGQDQTVNNPGKIINLSADWQYVQK